MRKFLVIFLLVFLTGCTAPLQNTQMETTEPTIDLGHADHHASKRRLERNFYVEKVQTESTEYYLSYHEPDGCSTRVYNLYHGYLEPKLFCQNNSFYFINQTEGYHTVISDGRLEKVSFSGEYSSLQVKEGFVLNYIIRTDGQYVYCAVNEGKAFLRADLALSSWEEIPEAIALGE